MQALSYQGGSRSSETGAERFYTGPDPATFDLGLLRKAFDEVMDRVQPRIAARGGDQVRTVSLTHRRQTEDRLRDGSTSQFTEAGTLRYLERDFCCFNEDFADTYFAVVHRAMPYPVGRMRLMFLAPGTGYRMHADASTRAHLAIYTDPEAMLIGPDGQGHHVPADGRLRVFDTRLRHTAFNAGSVDRIHLVMSLADTELDHHVATMADSADGGV